MNEKDDELMDELMLDAWDGLKEEPNSRKRGYPAKKQKKAEKQVVSEGKFYNLMGLVQGEVMRMPEKNTDPAVSEDQAMYFICFDLKKKSKNGRPTIRQGFKKIWNSWRRYIDKNGPKEYWVEEVTVDKKEEKVMDTVLTKEQWDLLSYMKDSCYGNHDYPNGSGMITYISNSEEEVEMAEEKKEMNLDDVVNAANAQAEQAEAVEDNNAVEEAQQDQVEEVIENVEENVKEVVNMANNENKKIEAAKEIEQQVVNGTVARKLANELMLHKADGSEITVKVNIIKNVDKDGKTINTRGKVMAFSEKLKKQVEIGSFVIGGGYSLPIFMIKCRGLKNETFKPVRDCDKENRMVRFHGSKNYFVLLSLLMNKEEIEAAKAAEIARFFPPIRERYESKGVEKNISVTVALDGETISLTGWVQREWRPLYLENEDRTITVRWDFGKGYQDPSIKFRGKMLRKNHDGISGTPEDAKVFEAIKDAIEDVLKG